MIPSVGRIVHYGAQGSEEPRAAIITRVVQRQESMSDLLASSNEANYVVSLLVHDQETDKRCYNVPFSATLKPGHWTWPPRTS